ncbi:MAG: LysR family transcriptional regulator [Azospirillaceae bacterium]|nr:LysR family transcriptional regulator [Azospirillaceae bacterium]
MEIAQLPLNALRAFEAAARHESFTRAGLELRVTQAAVSHQVKCLEEILGVPLFRRLPRGLALTEEGEALLPVLTEALHRIADTLDRFEGGRLREVLTLSVVGTFVTGWLLSRLPAFRAAAPFVDLRLMTNNNRVDLAGEGLDYAIRFGDGAWHGTEAIRLFEAPLSPLCAPHVALRLAQPADLGRETLLRSYRTDEWTQWFAAAGLPPLVIRGFVFDSSLAMAEAAAQGAGVALLPVCMFERPLREERLIKPFPIEISLGAYWLTRLKSRSETGAMRAFRDWLLAASDVAAGAVYRVGPTVISPGTS